MIMIITNLAQGIKQDKVNKACYSILVDPLVLYYLPLINGIV